MKPREPRQKVLIDARLRQDCGWSDARILDISRRGLMVRASIAPARGTYVEITRGTHRIVARVVWARDGRFGAAAQDPIDADAVARGDQAVAANLNSDRRVKRRESTGEREDRSRRRSRQLEFVVIAALRSGAAVLAFDTVDQTLSRPLSQIEATLAARREPPSSSR